MTIRALADYIMRANFLKKKLGERERYAMYIETDEIVWRKENGISDFSSWKEILQYIEDNFVDDVWKMFNSHADLLQDENDKSLFLLITGYGLVRIKVYKK